MRTKNSRVDMLHGSLPINLLRFALPVILSGVLQLAFNAADVIVVGRCAGDTALAAVTSSSPLMGLLVNAQIGFSMGTNVVVSQALGRRDEDYVERAVHACILLGVIVGVTIGIIGFLITPTVLRLTQTPPTVIAEATTYLRIYFLGAPAQVMYNFGAAVLHGHGDSRRPMKFLLVSGVLNLLLNLVFVLGLDMGVAGVGWATAIAHWLSCLLVLRCLMSEDGCHRLDLLRLRMDAQVLSEVVKNGVPASMQAVLMSLSNVVVQSGINSFGDVVMAGSGASGNIEGFIWIAMNAFYQAGLSFTGNNLGAGRLDRVDRVMVHSTWMAGAVGIFGGAIAYLFGRQLLGIYTDSAQAVEYGMLRMMIVVLPYCLYGMADAVQGSIRGMGGAVLPMISGLVFLCGFRLAWMGTVFPQYRTLPVLYTCYPISWVLFLSVNLLCWWIIRGRVRAKAELKEEGE